MNAVIGMSHLVLKTDLSPKQRDYISKIDQSSKALLNIINDILDFSKIEAGKLEIESIPFFLEDVLDNLSDLISAKTQEKGLELAFDIDPDFPQGLVGDPFAPGSDPAQPMQQCRQIHQKGRDRALRRHRRSG